MIRSGLLEGIGSRIAAAAAAFICFAWIGLGETAYAAHPGSPLVPAAAPSARQHLPQVAQACPRGYNYDWRSKRCRSAHDREYRGPSYRGGNYYYGGACPPGYNWGAGGCYPANQYYAPAPRYYGGPGCAPGYNWDGYGCRRNF